MAALLIEARDAARDARQAGKTALGPQTLASLTARYRALATDGLAANVCRRTATAKDARRIARRFLGFEDMILRFATRLTWTSSPTVRRREDDQAGQGGAA